MIKRMVSLFAAVCVAVASAVCAFAMSDKTISLSVGQDRVKLGESAELTVSAVCPEPVRGIRFTIAYDIGKMSVEKTEYGSAAQEALVVQADEKKPGRIAATMVFEQPYSLDEDILSVVFRVKDKTGLGDTTVSVRDIQVVTDDNTTVSKDAQSIGFEIYSDEIEEPTIKPPPHSTAAPTNAPDSTSAPSNNVSSGGGTHRADLPSAPSASEVPESQPTAVPVNVQSRKPDSACGFADIDSHWAAEDIKYLYDRGIINGLSNEEFAPEKQVTRAEFVTMLSKIAELSEASTNPFVDVHSDDWYYDAVLKGYSAGLIKGYGNTFDPDKNITREEMAVIADRCMEYTGVYSETRDTIAISFSDSAEFSDWSVDSIMKTARAGVINGIDGAFVPKSCTTRAQAAVIIKRIYIKGI